MTSESDWLTIPEVAARYRISPRTAYRWAESGRALRVLRTGPTGRGVRVHAGDLDRWELAQRQTSPTAA